MITERQNYTQLESHGSVIFNNSFLRQQMGRQNKFASTKDMNAKTIQHYFQPKESKRHKKEEADQSVSLSQFF